MYKGISKSVTKNELIDAYLKSVQTQFCLLHYINHLEDKQKASSNFVKDIGSLLNKISQKLKNYTPYTNEEFAAMDSQTRKLAKAKQKRMEQFSSVIRQAIFGKIIDIQENYDVSNEEFLDFFQQCLGDGVINLKSMVSQNEGNVKDHVLPKYKKVFDYLVRHDIFNYSPSATSGAIGPSEMALAIMGNPVLKSEKGDLNIDGQLYELKSSLNTGGRLNGKMMTKTTAGWSVWANQINDILKDAPSNLTIHVTDKNGKRTSIPLSKFDGNTYNYQKKSCKYGSKYNWNRSCFTLLNEEVLEPYSTRKKTFQLFSKTIKAMILNYDQIPNADKILKDAINRGGTVDYDRITKAYSYITFLSYKLSDNIEKILFLKTDTLDYYIVNNIDEFMEALGDKIVVSSGFTWNDDQQSPTPAYNVASKKVIDV